MSETFPDLVVIQSLMKKMQEATDACMALVAKADDALEKLVTHNTDAMAHQDIRNSLDAENAATNDFVDERIEQHNTLATAHPELVAKLQAAIKDSAKVRLLIDEVVSAHNFEATAHADIRSAVNELKLQLGSINLTQISDELNRVIDTVDGTMAQAIIDLQSVDAKHDALIAANSKELESAKTLLENIEKDILLLSSGDFLRQKDIDKLVVDQFAGDMGEKLGISQYNEEGPNLVNFTHTLPTYIGKDSTVQFTLNGTTSTNDVKYSIEQGKGDVQISPKSDIENGQEITMLVGNNAQPGDIVYFTVIAEDKVTGQQSKTVLACMFARPINIEHITCYGLPENIEPGQKYSFYIRNLIDDKSGRFKYQIDSLTSELLFNKQDNIEVNEVIEMTVPSSIERDQVVSFNVVVVDLYSEKQNKEIQLYVNAIPGAEDFEHNIPAIVSPESFYNIKFRGIVSADGVAATYSIKNNAPELVFSKSDNILANENILMSVTGDVVRGQEYKFDVVSKDENGYEIIIPQGVVINQLPTSSDIQTTLPAETKGGQVMLMRISGGADSETGITYTIDADKSGFNFSKISGIKSSDNIEVRLPKVAEPADRTFNVYAVDALGERSETPRVITVRLLPIYVADTPYIISPQEGNEVLVDFEIIWSEFSSHVDTVQTVDEPIRTF